MDGSNLSFIPKKNLTAPASKEKGASFAFSLSIIILLISLLSYGGVFLYQQTLKTEIETKQATLDKIKDQLDPQTVRGINELSRRIEALKTILANHRSFGDFFRFLGESTLKSVRFSSFSYSDTGESPTITLQGAAKSFGSISLQAKKFGENPNIKNVLFTGFALKEGGIISFSVKINADSQLFSYRPNQEKQ